MACMMFGLISSCHGDGHHAEETPLNSIMLSIL